MPLVYTKQIFSNESYKIALHKNSTNANCEELLFYKSHLTWGVEKCHIVYLTFNTLNMQWKQHEQYTTLIVEKFQINTTKRGSVMASIII